MIPKEQKEPVMAVTGDLSGPVPVLDLGKKLSVPQDLMIEELSLRNNRGSLLFQKRQQRVQRFTFELSDSLHGVLAGSARGRAAGRAAETVADGPEGQSHGSSEPHAFPDSGDLGGVPRAAAPAESVRGPSALAPGYAEPLKGVPPEKFNHTAIPKGYHSPWQELVRCRDYASTGGRSRTPRLRLRDYRNFNK